MNVAVVVPWRAGGCPYRLAAWERVRNWWEAWGLTPITADDGGDPFSRAASINEAVRAQPDADVYVIADADTLVDNVQVQRAAGMAGEAPGLVVAFNRFAYLTEEGSALVLAPWGHLDSWEPWVAWELRDTVSSCVAVSRATWEAVGGFPAQFRGWGYEDVAFEVACATLCAPTRRVEGTAWHLWHPPARERPTENVGRLDALLSVRDDPLEFRERMAVSW